MKFIVDRKTWYRGNGEDGSQLLRADGTRCCIGFVGSQVGLDDAELIGNSSISQCEIVTVRCWPKWMIPDNFLNAGAIQTAYITNDDPTITDAVREQNLKDIFDSQGDEIEFVG